MNEKEKAWEELEEKHSDGSWHTMQWFFYKGWNGAEREAEHIALDKDMKSVRATVFRCPNCRTKYELGASDE